jgi:hypothetical protein
MGCSTSAPVQPKTTPTQTDDITSPEQIDFIRSQMTADYPILISNVRVIPKPPAAVPVVTIAPTSFPLVLASFADEIDGPPAVFLPYLAVAYTGIHGRIFCAGNSDFFTIASRESSALLARLVKWGAPNPRGPMPFICVLGIPLEFAMEFQAAFQDGGFLINVRDVPRSMNKVDVIVCLSNCEYLEALETHLKGGGCLMCAPAPEEDKHQWRINSLLLKYGIGFSPSKVNLGPSEGVGIQVTEDGAEICMNHQFDSLVERYIAIVASNLDLSEPALEELDSLVAMLTYHLTVLPREQHTVVANLIDVTVSAMERQGYETADGICPSVIDGLLVELLVGAFEHVPARYFQGKDNSRLFPGRVKWPNQRTVTVSIDLSSTGWHSSGYYLLPGEMAVCNFDLDDRAGLCVQVGSHAVSLLRSQGPWPRWPVASSTFEANGPETVICSMLGGMIYFVNRFPLSQTTVTLTNVTEYGIFRDGEWTAGYDVAPFCEILTQKTILTCPADMVHLIRDLSKSCERIDSLIAAVVGFCGGDEGMVFRIVFDVHLPGHAPVFRRVIFLEYDFFAPLLVDDAPSSSLLTVLTAIGAISLPTLFTESDQGYLGMFGALMAFRERWNDVSLLDEVMDVPPHIHQFWDWISGLNDPSVVAQAITAVSKGGPRSPAENWKAMLADLSSRAGSELPLTIDKVQ